MLSSCFRGFPLPRRSPLCLSDWAFQYDRTLLVLGYCLAARVFSQPSQTANNLYALANRRGVKLVSHYDCAPAEICGWQLHGAPM